uniref:Glucose-methanol-choline oxidoreductase N-terminal domain-containing protein n=1 Tax=Graphocephala atropunctata TaxID=36148 RepID=A0A1B6KJ14_9HEMI
MLMEVWTFLVTVFVTLCHENVFARGWDSKGECRSTGTNRLSCLLDLTCSAHYNDTAAQTIQSVYTTLASADCELANPCYYPPQYDPWEGEEFDFVVVGAGSAGCVVANRLTEISGWTVLVLERGGNPTKTTEVPAYNTFQIGSEVDWKYQTEPSDKYCLGMVGKTCNWVRGKVLGGTSSINYMLYVRGNKKDYDKWALEGLRDWSYKKVLPYFKKSEDMRAPEVLANQDSTNYHNTGGYLKVDTFYNGEFQPLTNAMCKGFNKLGYHTNIDVNGGNQSGCAILHGTLVEGRRCSNAKAFLTPIVHRDNLYVSKHCLATKILFDENDNTARGVEFIDRKGNTVRVRARKEVVVCAGAINSPQLLMLSGIGPREHLQEFGIRVISDLPVGENLEDHSVSFMHFYTTNFTRQTESSAESMTDFLLKKNKRLSGIGLASTEAFININSKYPNVQLSFAHTNINDPGLRTLLEKFNFNEEIISKYLEVNAESSVMVATVSLQRPHSSGSVKLKSTDPKVYPRLIAGYFSNTSDFDIYLRSIEFLYSLEETEGFQSFGAKIHEVEVPECSAYTLASDEFKICCLRYLTASSYHFTGTCRMGPPDSSNRVLDSYLRVLNVNSLRVIDGASIPHAITGNPNAAITMLAEKGADYIKTTWLSK